MMKIGGVSEQSSQIGQAGMSQMTDAVSKNLQTQIMNAQRQLKDLSSNEELSSEEKMEKRKEIQQQLADLNSQLRKHQIEMRQEKQQSKESQSKEVFGEKKEASKQDETKAIGMSDKSMKAMISADTAVSFAKSQGSLKTALEGRVDVLEVEIAQDASRGGATESKEEELEDLEKRLSNVTGSQVENLSLASDEIQTAMQEELEEKKGSEGETEENIFKKSEIKDISAFINTVKSGQRVATDFSSMNIVI